jgi:hypothetical protein
MPSSPPRLARAPDFAKVTGDAAAHKRLAYAAYQKARQAEPIPIAYVDRLWVGTLSAAEAAPPAVAAKMLRRSETLMCLLTDWSRWPRA